MDVGPTVNGFHVRSTSVLQPGQALDATGPYWQHLAAKVYFSEMIYLKYEFNRHSISLQVYVGISHIYTGLALFYLTRLEYITPAREQLVQLD